ncbi:outer-membrane lipoprotein carrier protein LolA [Tundrisphaera sp. TA3]|uniref:outer-membrane lipoprotein carrier protein LolA n=1 Tax=Tundrisphaera sp. TA3 TaxID=3435775 RepID=UPI003EBCC2A3
MKTHIAWILALAAVAGAVAPASAQQAPPARPARPQPAAGAGSGVRVAPAPTAKPDPVTEKLAQQAAAKLRQEMDQILVAWEKQSSQVKSLSVDFKRIDKSAAWGEEEFTGQAVLQSPDLACLNFKKRTNPDAGPDAKPIYEDDERIVSTGSEVLQYKWDTMQIYVYPLDKQAQQKTLQQGPLPFLFNMKADEARKRYDMALTNQSDKQYLIRIAPLYDIDRESFSKAFLWLNKTTFLPDQLWLVATNGKDYQDFRFNNVATNQKIDPKFFQKIKLPGWKEVVNDGNEGRAAAAPAAAPAGGKPAPGRGAIQPTRPAPAAATRGAAAPR